MKKSAGIFCLILLFFIFGNSNAHASASLTQEEKELLINVVGLSSDDLEILPVETLREFIEQDAKVVLEGTTTHTIYDAPKDSNGEYLPEALISPKKLQLTGKAIKLSNASNGRKRYNLYGTWKWLSSPANTYVDAMSIGFESGKGIVIPTSGGNVVEHSHEYATYERGVKNRREYSTRPDSYYPGAGVGALYDLRQGGVSHQGYISQNVQMSQSTGVTNLKFEYAHAKTIFNPSFSVSKGIFGITPGVSIDTNYYADTLEW
ncbi:hypothetical protein [Bacillus sp. CHD6a]|uniref:hypothetical protein n=1 Tax=Bacillus sp. CHD6a TaxID=1643452 RepID=UPI0006CD4E82|nr:hypothetical protein [Bacillus sp. CHD6a]KPB03068.1 hypothetical protein AAV98_19200 [Bacillus sp. CHD6a]